MEPVKLEFRIVKSTADGRWFVLVWVGGSRGQALVMEDGMPVAMTYPGNLPTKFNSFAYAANAADLFRSLAEGE